MLILYVYVLAHANELNDIHMDTMYMTYDTFNLNNNIPVFRTSD